MNKFNLRISAIGGTLLLVSIAFALAQHDSRRRSRSLEDAAQVPSQPAVPIEFATAAPDWHQAPPEPLVRANDGDLDLPNEAPPMPPGLSADMANEDVANLQLPSADVFNNPLRESAEVSLVVTASGEGPPSGPKPAVTQPPASLPAGPPSWLSENLPQTASQAPPPAKPVGLPNPTIPPLPSATQLPSTSPPSTSPLTSTPTTNNPPSAAPGLLPTYPIGGTTQPSTALPSAPSGFGTSSPAVPAYNASGVNSMSDTQRGAMSATSFPPTQTGTSQNGTSQPASNLPTGNFPANQSNLTNQTNALNQASQSSQSTQPNNNFGQPSSFGSPSGAGNTQFPSAVNRAPMNNTARTPAALTSLVSNEPGSRYLDGSQNPIMLIQKRGPEEVRVGRVATFVITVRNAGNSTAHDVTVQDSVPLGMRFSEANPPVNPTAEGLLTWQLGEMHAGDERTINLQMIPERQGELGSVASVHFAAQASLRTVATQPKLEIQIDAQQESLIGDSQLIAVTVKNVGTGVARGVRLEADLPEQLRHESGDQHLEAIFPSELAPNQSQRIELRSTAAQPGDAMCVIRALTEDGAEAQQQVPITVTSPTLVAAIEGPRLRYLDRQATYKFKVQNNGTATATNLKFVVRLPSGLRFNSSDNNNADYNPADHTVTLGLQELPINTPAVFELTVLPVERGTQVLTLNALADLGISTEAKGQVVVEGLAELAFTIGQDNGTIEVGSSSTYTVQVTNIGNNPDKDVRLAVQLPAGAQVLKVDAPVRYRAEGNQIQFEPIAEMRNKDQHTFRFEVRHTQPGSMIVRTQLTSANWPVAVVKEEGTLVYNDQN